MNLKSIGRHTGVSENVSIVAGYEACSLTISKPCFFHALYELYQNKKFDLSWFKMS